LACDNIHVNCVTTL